MICPKYNYQRKPDDDAADWQCPSCGIAYANFQQSSEPAAPTEPEEKPKMDFNSVLTISTVLCAILLAIKGFAGGGVSIFNGLLLIPFFICIVTILSSLLCHDIYYWNRWKMQFEAYDKSQHPMMYWLLITTSVLGSVAFLIFFFMLK